MNTIVEMKILKSQYLFLCDFVFYLESIQTKSYVNIIPNSLFNREFCHG